MLEKWESFGLLKSSLPPRRGVKPESGGALALVPQGQQEVGMQPRLLPFILLERRNPPGTENKTKLVQTCRLLFVRRSGSSG